MMSKSSRIFLSLFVWLALLFFCAMLPADAQDKLPTQEIDTVPAIPVGSDVDYIETLKQENTRLRDALERERRNYENRFMSRDIDSSSAVELKEKLRLLEIENKNLKARVPASAKVAADSSECSALESKVEALRGHAASLQAENMSLASRISEMKAGGGASAAVKDKSVVPQVKAEWEEKLSAQLRLNGEQNEKIAVLQREKQALEARLTENREQRPIVDSETQTRLLLLEKENSRLKKELASSQSQLDEKAATAKGDMKIVARLKAVEAELATAQAKNERLLRTLDEYRKGERKKLVNASSSDWNLEKATRRFNEAEREIVRLGEKIEEERVACEKEKREIEYMLFDPAIAEKEQIAKLVALEEELQEAKEALQRQGGRSVSTGLNPISSLNKIGYQAQKASYSPPPVSAASLSSSSRAPLRAPVDKEMLADSAPESVSRSAVLKTWAGRDVLSEGEIQEMLDSAGIAVQGSVSSVDSDDRGVLAYSWNSGPLYGTIEQSKAAGRVSAEAMIQQYLDKTKGRCPGDFAAMPTTESKARAAHMDMASYEIACIGSDISASASVLFVNKGDVFVALAHETDADNMDVAMDARDRLLSLFAR